MDGCSTVVVIGSTEQDPGAPPLLPRVLKFDGCEGDDFAYFDSTNPDRIAPFLLKAPAAVVCAALAATDGDINSLPETDTAAEIYSLTRSILKGNLPLVAGALTDVHVVPVTGRGELDFRDVASWVREGQHGLEVTDSVRSLYDRATNGWELGSVVALHAYVHESTQSRREAFAAEIAEADALNSRAAVALDDARAVGKISTYSAVLYEPPHMILAALHDPEEVKRRTFGDSYERLLLAFSDEGVACLGVRAGSRSEARHIDERVGELLERLREQDSEAGDETIYVVPQEYAFEKNIQNMSRSWELYDAAHKHRVFTAGVIDVFAANPGVSLDSPLLDACRAYIAPNDDQIAAWRAESRGGHTPTVAFNSGGGFRTVEDYTLERQRARRAELEAEAARQAAAREAGEPDVHSRKSASSGSFAKKTNRDFEAELKPNGTWDRVALEDLLKHLNDEIRKRKDNSSYRLQWPSKVDYVKTSLNPLIVEAGGEGYGLKSGLALMEHFAKELKKIKDACA